MHHPDPIAQDERLDHVMGNEQHGAPARAPDTRELVLHLAAGLRVQGGERLVHEQHVRLGRQNPRDLDPLFHAAGQFARKFVAVAVEAHQLQQALGDIALLGLVQTADSRPEQDIVPGREPGHQGIVALEYDPAIGTRTAHRFAAVQRLAIGRHFEASQQRQGRGLAAAARAEQAEELPLPDGDFEILKSRRAGILSPARRIASLPR